MIYLHMSNEEYELRYTETDGLETGAPGDYDY